MACLLHILPVMRVLLIVLLILAPTGIMAKEEGNNPLAKAGELINAGRAEEALSVLSGYSPDEGEFPLYHYLYGKALALRGSYDSIGHLRLAYILSPPGETKELALLERGMAYLNMGFYYEAALCFRLFLGSFPNSPLSKGAHLKLGESLYKLGLFNEAIEEYEKAGNTSPALYGKANCLQSMGRKEEANALYMSLIWKDAGYLRSSDETRYSVAENLRQMGRPNDSRIYLVSILENSKDPSIIHRAEISLGLINAEEGEFRSAIGFFKSALQSQERQVRSQALLHLADTYIKMERYEDAVSTLLEIRNDYPYGSGYDTATLKLSRLYRQRGKLDEAAALIREIASRQPSNREASDELEAILLDTEGKDSDLFLRLWKANGRFLMEPSRSRSLIRIAEGLRNTGRPFLDICRWLMENGSDDVKPLARLYLAGFFADMGDGNLALKYIGETNREESDDVLRIKAKVHRLNSEYEEALRAIRSIKDMNEEDIVLLSRVLKESGDTKEIGFFEEALNRVGGPMAAYVALADLLHGMGRRADALKYYRIAASMKDPAIGKVTLKDSDWARYMTSMFSETKTGAPDPLARLREITQKELDIAKRIKGEL